MKTKPKAEVTSARVARIAGKVLRLAKLVQPDYPLLWEIKNGKYSSITAEDVRTIAASCLTQAADGKGK